MAGATEKAAAPGGATRPEVAVDEQPAAAGGEDKQRDYDVTVVATQRLRKKVSAGSGAEATRIGEAEIRAGNLEGWATDGVDRIREVSAI